MTQQEQDKALTPDKPTRKEILAQSAEQLLTSQPDLSREGLLAALETENERFTAPLEPIGVQILVDDLWTSWKTLESLAFQLSTMSDTNCDIEGSMANVNTRLNSPFQQATLTTLVERARQARQPEDMLTFYGGHDHQLEETEAHTHPVPPQVLDTMRASGVYQGAYLNSGERTRIIEETCAEYHVELGGLQEVVEAIVGRILTNAEAPLASDANEAVRHARQWLDQVSAAATDQTSTADERLRQEFEAWLAVNLANTAAGNRTDALWLAFKAGASFQAPERISFNGALYVKAGAPMPEECLRESCTYFRFYLVNYDPSNAAHGRFLEHPAYHFAEQQCAHAQDRIDQWLQAHQSSPEPMPESLERLARYWEGRVCA